MSVKKSDDEVRRALKWLSFTKPKLVFGFDHLSPAYIPLMSPKLRGLSISFDKVLGWSPPTSLLDAVDSGDYEISVQLSFSLFHLNSKSFFGTTWMGTPISLGDGKKSLPDIIDFDYNEIIYMMSRITDPTCVGVVEIVASKIDIHKNLSVAQYGCGWTMLNMFSSLEVTPGDVSDGYENVLSTSCTFLTGSPRDLLLLGNNINSLSSNIKESKGCTLSYKLYYHKKLLKAQRLIAENEIVGRFDIIAGLLNKSVVPPNETKTISIPCIGDEEIIDNKGKLFIYPSKPIIAIPMKLSLVDFQLLIPDREELERRMILSLTNANDDGMSQIQIISRNLKVGLHNGHTIIGGEWQTQSLIEDTEEKDMLFTSLQKIDVLGYVPHDLMNLVFLIEYEIGIPVQHKSYYNSQAILNSTMKKGKAVTTIVIGASIFIPSNGSTIFLRNRPKRKDGMGVELQLQYEDIATILSGRQVYGSTDKILIKRAEDAIKKIKMKKNAEFKRNSQSKGGESDEEDNDEFDENDSIMLAFDLHATDALRGELEHEDDVIIKESDDNGLEHSSLYSPRADSIASRSPRDEKESSYRKSHNILINSNRSSKDVKKMTFEKSKIERQRLKDNDEDSVTESLVGGDSETSSLRLDSNYYSNRNIRGNGGVRNSIGGYGRALDNDVVSVISNDDHTNMIIPKNRSSLLAQSMQAKIIGRESSGKTSANIINPNREAMDTDIRQSNGGNNFYNESNYMRNSVVKNANIVTSTTPGLHTRDITRGARSRLSRHGFNGIINDNNNQDSRIPNINSSSNVSKITVDIQLEARDILSIHDVQLQFAGYRVGLSNSSGKHESLNYPSPRAVYFSYQFYTCMSTRTEPMRLQTTNEKGGLCVLSRDEAHARDDTPLALRYIVDCSQSSSTEALEFAEYMSHSSLYVDVWDADSLMLIGTIGIPLRRLMRQGQPMSKCVIECDVINSEMYSQSHGGVTSSIITEGGPLSGTVVGSVHIIMSNFGQPGRAESKKSNQATSFKSNNQSPVDGLNWRALGVENNANVANVSKNRPKYSVRAKPLSESAPELSQALQNHRNSVDGINGPSIRSLTATRGSDNSNTLTYDEVISLFKRFQGTIKGTIQYNGALLSLLDVPSWNMSSKKLMKAYQLSSSNQIELEKELLRYSDTKEMINSANLQEYFRVLLERNGIPFRNEELAILAHKFTKDDNGHVRANEVISYCRGESDRQEWSSVSKRVRRIAQKCIITGVNLEQMLEDKDTNGDNFISCKNLKDFLLTIRKYGKLSEKDIDVTVKYLSNTNSNSGEERPRNDSVSLHEVMAFLGKQYQVNKDSQLKKLLVEKDNTISDKNIEIFRSNDRSDKGVLSFDEIETSLASIGVYRELTHDQVNLVLKKLEKNNKINLIDLFKRLGVSNITSNNNNNSNSNHSSNNAEGLLRLLLEKIQKNGLPVEDIFRHFDSDGDGVVSEDELLEGLEKLNIFENIPNWKLQIPVIVKKFDVNGDNSLNLKEFFNFLGITDYSPNTIQKMTKIFALSTDKGLTIDDIFNELDSNNTNELTAENIKEGLTILGTFGDVTIQDCNAVVNHFENDEIKTISKKQFIDFFTKRIDKIKIEKKKKKSFKIANRFRDIMRTAQDKGLTSKELFNHFHADDNTNTSTISSQELSSGLHKIPLFKSLKDEDISNLVDLLDIDNTGEISYKSFIKFIQEPIIVNNTSPLENYKNSIGYYELGNTSSARGQNNPLSLKLPENEEKSERKEENLSKLDIFIKQLTKISQADNGIHGMVAYLDNDEDGKITVDALYNFFKKEGLFEFISEREVDNILHPITTNRTVDVISFINLIEGKTISSKDKDDNNDDDDNNDGLIIVEYDFSNDPETRTLEKKMRNLGRVLAKKGMDVEALFKKFDTRESGMIRRTEFIEIMSKMGLYILETGKVLEDAINDGNDVRKQQLTQINKVKGIVGGTSYSQNAARVARSYVMNGGDNGRGGDFKEHLESMALINWYRQSQKKLLLQRVLSHSLASSIRIYPRFGKTLFFEHPITNPFGHEERFIIDINDPELRLVTSFDEWLHLRQTTSPHVGELGEEPVEAEMFDRDSDGNIQVVLLPHETLHIPFTFMTLVPFTPQDMENKNKLIKNKMNKSESKDNNLSSNDIVVIDEEEPRRTIEVRVISGTHGHIISVLKINVCPRPFIVHRTLRFYEPENSTMRRRIQLVSNNKNNSYPGEFTMSNKYIHCVEGSDVANEDGQSKVVIEWGPSTLAHAGALDLFLRYKVGGFPNVGTFHLLLYDDPYQSQLNEIWHVIVYARQRLDIHSSVGGVANIDLVVRGDSFARRAKPFASPSQDLVSFVPESTFKIVPGAYNRIGLNFTPKMIGSKRMQINLVDVDSKDLLSAWILTTTASAPAVMRTYDVDIAHGRATHKKIIYKNPWDQPKKFVMATSDEYVMKSRVPTLQVPPHGNAYLRLWFSGHNGPLGTTSEVYLFLNDENGQNEESFLFRIHYVSSDNNIDER